MAHGLNPKPGISPQLVAIMLAAISGAAFVLIVQLLVLWLT